MFWRPPLVAAAPEHTSFRNLGEALPPPAAAYVPHTWHHHVPAVKAKECEACAKLAPILVAVLPRLASTLVWSCSVGFVPAHLWPSELSSHSFTALAAQFWPHSVHLKVPHGSLSSLCSVASRLLCSIGLRTLKSVFSFGCLAFFSLSAFLASRCCLRAAAILRCTAFAKVLASLILARSS